MLYSIVLIIVGFEIINFILKAILPNNKLDSSITNALNMIIFSGIIMLCANLLLNNNFSFLSLDKLIISQDIDSTSFEDYIDIYKKIISQALE